MVNRQTISGDEIQIFKRRTTETSVAPRCLHVTTGCRDKTPGCPREKLCRSNTLADTGNDSCHTSVTSPSSERVVNEGGGEPSGEEARPGISSPARAGRSNGWPPNCVRGWTQPMSCQPKAGIGAAHDRQNGLLTADDSLPHFLTPYLCEAFNVPPRLSSATSTCLSSGRTAVTCLMLHAVPSLLQSCVWKGMVQFFSPSN